MAANEQDAVVVAGMLVSHLENKSAGPAAPLLTVADVAQRLRVSRRTVIRWFGREPGVIVVKHPEKMHKRGYRTIRVPEPVFLRFLERKKLR